MRAKDMPNELYVKKETEDDDVYFLAFEDVADAIDHDNDDDYVAVYELVAIKRGLKSYELK